MSEQALRAHYDKTALARMGILFERGMAIEAVRIAVEGAVRVDALRVERMPGRTV